MGDEKSFGKTLGIDFFFQKTWLKLNHKMSKQLVIVALYPFIEWY